jgi:hypothetical protein
MMPAETLILLAFFILLYTAFLFWYGGRGKPLSQTEVDALLVEMQRRAGKQGQVGAESPILQQFRELTKNDDGQEYYMVNLLKFRKRRFFQKESPLGMNRWQPTTATTGPSSRCCSNMGNTRFSTA